MTQQHSLFETAVSPESLNVHVEQKPAPSIERFEGALLGGAIGDALGWPVEFWKAGTTFSFDYPLRKYVTWSKNQGGAYGWGYTDYIGAGSYSDDTQLSLAVARCIDENGVFEPERFAYSEFPLWLHYERGGGRTIKKAAHKLLQKRTVWNQNFYRVKDSKGVVDYREAGANGAAMRVVPLALANPLEFSQLTSDVFRSSIITHGHPRAILGAWMVAYALQFALADEDLKFNSLKTYIWERLRECDGFIRQDNIASSWVNALDQNNRSNSGGNHYFLLEWKQTLFEIKEMFDLIEQSLDKEPIEFYRIIGALDYSTKGSGTITAGVAIYQFLRHHDNPLQAVFSTVDMLGSDTDTIGALVGALVGARFGVQVWPTYLSKGVQDQSYILQTAQRLHRIAAVDNDSVFTASKTISKPLMLQRLLAWEIGLHEMFWDAIGEGDNVHHPALGKGTIESKETKNLSNEAYIAKLISIKFDCGQSCVFHSRVKKQGGELNESLTKDLIKALYNE